MALRYILACLGLAAASVAAAQTAVPAIRPGSPLAEREANYWPAWVAPVDQAGKANEWQAVGPLFFKKLLPEGRTAAGFRPFYLKKWNPAEGETETSFLYPLFVYRRYPATYRWSVFSLINRMGPRDGGAAGPGDTSDQGLDIWPVYFSRNTGAPDTTYRAIFPVVGTVKNRFYVDRADWVLFPLYLHTQNKGATVVSVPWPFLRFISGNGHSGFALWPLFGWRQKPGVYHKEFYLWPLIYRSADHLDEPVPTEGHGFLPFYSHDSSPGVMSENYLWPFFGHTDRTEPYRYHETRYFWPFLVQGRGDDHYRNRWGPFYTHSVIKGDDKTWYLWPLVRREAWTDNGLKQVRTQFFFFIYWSLKQSSATNPALESAQKTHLWPLYSYWNNGAGHRQFQLFSPIDVFLPENENAHLLWSPLFAIYRHDQTAPGSNRGSILFRLITWRREPGQHEFHFGPLYSSESTPAGSRVKIAGGLLGFRRTGPAGWRAFWFDFSANPDKSTSRPPADSPPP